MNNQNQFGIAPCAQVVEELAVGKTETAKNAVPPVPGCDVIEYDEPTGQQEWSDSLFVQDFTDSVLATTPATLDINQGKL